MWQIFFEYRPSLVITFKLISELIDHAFSVTARLVKSDDIEIDPVTLSVVGLLCGSTSAIVVFGSAPVEIGHMPVRSFADAAVRTCPKCWQARHGFAHGKGCDYGTGALARCATDRRRRDDGCADPSSPRRTDFRQWRTFRSLC